MAGMTLPFNTKRITITRKYSQTTLEYFILGNNTNSKKLSFLETHTTTLLLMPAFKHNFTTIVTEQETT